MTSISEILRPARSRTFCEAGAGPIPIILGSTPAVAQATTLALIVNPCCFAASSLAIIIAAAPSFTPLAFPGVTLPPSFLKGVGNLESASKVVSGLGCSSLFTIVTSPLLPGISTVRSSLAIRPLSIALPAFVWLPRANLSWSSLLI